jgi:hypothetical protein
MGSVSRATEIVDASRRVNPPVDRRSRLSPGASLLMAPPPSCKPDRVGALRIVRSARRRRRERGGCAMVTGLIDGPVGIRATQWNARGKLVGKNTLSPQCKHRFTDRDRDLRQRRRKPQGGGRGEHHRLQLLAFDLGDPKAELFDRNPYDQPIRARCRGVSRGPPNSGK